MTPAPAARLSRRAALIGLSAAGLLASRPAGAATGGACAAPASYLDGILSAGQQSPVTLWTDHLLQKVRDTATPPPPATRAFAIGHLAGFAALNGLTPRYHIALTLPEPPEPCDPAVAYGAAVAVVIGALFPERDGCALARFLATRPDGEAKSNGVAWGSATAWALLADRAGDGSAAARGQLYGKRAGPMAWQRTGPFFAAEEGPRFRPFGPPLLPGWGKITPFVLGHARDFRPRPFPRLDSGEFRRQLEKVFLWGGAASPYRTADQAEIAFFWEDGPRGATPPGHWQIIATELMQRQPRALLEQARFMALLSLAQADAAIVTWDCKFDMDVLRPETAIRSGLPGQPHLARFHDPQWRTLIPTPPFPAYTSGHSTFSAASARMLAHLLGTDHVSFTGRAPDLVNWPRQLTGVRRSFMRLSQAAEEAGASREYGGIHWEADNTEGLRIGALVADAVFDSALPRLG